jgi:uncharacterized protein DUF3309
MEAPMSLLLLLLVLFLILGGLPTWNLHSYGWGPSSAGGVVLLVLLVLLLMGRL